MGFPDGSAVKNPPGMQEIWVPSLDQEDPLEEEIATTPVFFFFLKLNFFYYSFT